MHRVTAAGARRAASSTAAAAAVASASAGATPAVRARFDSLPAAASLSPGLLDMLHAQLGPKAKPTHVQELCLNHFFPPQRRSSSRSSKKQSPTNALWLKQDAQGPSETLIAAETGSGKTLAYLLPLLNHLKATDEHDTAAAAADTSLNDEDDDEPMRHLVQPRAIILAPTHELARQLAASAKNMCHIDKLKVLCLSSGGWLDHLRAGVAQLTQQDRLLASLAGGVGVAREDEEEKEEEEEEAAAGRMYMHPDIIVSTPSRLLSTLANARQVNSMIDDAAAVAELRSNRGVLSPQTRAALREAQRGHAEGKGKGRVRERDDRQPLISLARVRSIVIDEADVLLAPDFGPSTRAVLHLARREQQRLDPSIATLAPVPAEPGQASSSKLTLEDITAPPHNPKRDTKASALEQLDEPSASSSSSSFPFDLVLATATIPTSLAGYLRSTHPNITTLASNRLHKLPSRLKADFVDPGGNKLAAVARQIRMALSEPGSAPASEGSSSSSNKVLIFMNRAKSVEILSKYLTENGISNVAISSSIGTRSKNSNAHIKTFLRERKLSDKRDTSASPSSNISQQETPSSAAAEEEEEEAGAADSHSPEQRGGEASSASTPAPRVLITTSLLSRGLDFDPSVSHVLLPDRIAYSTSGFGARRLASGALPGDASSSAGAGTVGLASASATGINELELLHRAGRAARAGSAGKVVIFDKRAALSPGFGSSSSSSASGGRSARGGGRMQMVRNKAGKYVPKAAAPLRKAVRGLLVSKLSRPPSAPGAGAGSAGSYSFAPKAGAARGAPASLQTAAAGAKQKQRAAAEPASASAPQWKSTVRATRPLPSAPSSAFIKHRPRAMASSSSSTLPDARASAAAPRLQIKKKNGKITGVSVLGAATARTSAKRGAGGRSGRSSNARR
ncbi:RNA helicase [Tilletia horrida]|nr:RNA helicase [Tilletia horrida]KAK0561747.1 RNA helicase [Tilletia horrida]